MIGPYVKGGGRMRMQPSLNNLVVTNPVGGVAGDGCTVMIAIRIPPHTP